MKLICSFVSIYFEFTGHQSSRSKTQSNQYMIGVLELQFPRMPKTQPNQSIMVREILENHES